MQMSSFRLFGPDYYVRTVGLRTQDDHSTTDSKKKKKKQKRKCKYRERKIVLPNP